MWLGELLHTLKGILVKLQLQVEGLGNGLVCNIVMSMISKKKIVSAGIHCKLKHESLNGCGSLATFTVTRAVGVLCSGWYRRWADASTCDNEIVARTHAADCLNYILFIIWNYFDPLELNAEVKAELGKEGGIGIDGLEITGKVVKYDKYDSLELFSITYLPTEHLIANDQTCRGVDGLRVRG